MQKVNRSWPAIHDERIIEKEKNAANHFFRFNERTAEKEAILGVAAKPQPAEKEPEAAVIIKVEPAKATGKPKTQKRKVSKKQK